MNLIRDINRASRVETDPVKAAIAETEMMGSDPVDEFVARFGGELRTMDREAAAEAIGDMLENDPAHQYGEGSEEMIAAVLHRLGL